MTGRHAAVQRAAAKAPWPCRCPRATVNLANQVGAVPASVGW